MKGHEDSTGRWLSKEGVFTTFSLIALILFIFHPLPSNYYLEMSGLSSSTGSSSSSSSSSRQTFSLVVTLTFQDAAAKQEFVELFRPLADYVKRHEPTTLGYEVLMSDKNDLQALLLERYADKEEAYLKIHKSSAEFLSFRPQLQALQEAGRVTISGHSYLDAGIGFVGRNGE